MVEGKKLVALIRQKKWLFQRILSSTDIETCSIEVVVEVIIQSTASHLSITFELRPERWGALSVRCETRYSQKACNSFTGKRIKKECGPN